MADTSGLIIGLDLPSYGELAKMNHLAERRERAAKRKLRLVQEAVVRANARGYSAAETRQAVLDAMRGRVRGGRR